MVALVFMGVAGCGKSSVAAGVAAQLGLALIEGDDYHPTTNVEKMRAGRALTDEDRSGWLATLGDLLTEYPQGVVMTCSALKRRYRDALRLRSPGLQFVFLELTPEVARQRVSQRGVAHFMPVALVDSQFADLESPVGEPGVLQVDASLALEDIVQAAVQWIRPE